MTITSVLSEISYSGNSATVSFPVPYYFLLDTDLVITETTGSTVVTMDLNVDYTVGGAGDLTGGAVTMTTATATGTTLKIARVVPITQLTDYIQDDAFPAESHEKALDKLTMICQQLQTDIDNLVLEGITDATTASNIGGGLGWYKQKVGLDLQFRSVSSPASGTVGMAIVSNRIEIDVKHLLTLANTWADIQSHNALVRMFGAGGIIVADPDGFTPSAARMTRYAASGAGPDNINGAAFVHTQVDPGATDYEWNMLTRLDNYATSLTVDNVSFYSQAYKNAASATWAGVFEAHDTTHTQPSRALYGLEIDISANGTDISGLGFAQRFGCQMVGYRDDPPTTQVTASITSNVMTVTVIDPDGVGLDAIIVDGSFVQGLGLELDTTITSFGTGAGGVGTYNVSATPNVASRSMWIGGGAANHIGNGLVIQAADGDPYGSVFTNSINIASNGDVGIAIPGNHVVAIYHAGISTYGMKWEGTYATAVWSINTASDVPLMAMDSAAGLSYFAVIGTPNNFLNADAIGTYAGCMKIKVDGNDRFIPFYSH